jgi:hypothetical protein
MQRQGYFQRYVYTSKWVADAESVGGIWVVIAVSEPLLLTLRGVDPAGAELPVLFRSDCLCIQVRY